MLPIKCSKCGHIQDAGSAASPNETCERCGSAIYGFRANGKALAVLAVLALIHATILEMPVMYLGIMTVVTILLIRDAIVPARR